MLKRVDEPCEKITVYGYANEDGVIETVSATMSNVVRLRMSDADGGYDLAAIFKSDIPKLIKALQAAYDHKE